MQSIQEKKISTFWYILSFHTAGEKHRLWAAHKHNSKLDDQPVLAAFRRKPITAGCAEGITGQGLQELQSHPSPCDAESSGGNKRTKMRQHDPLIQHFNCLPSFRFLSFTSCSLVSLHQKSQGRTGTVSSHVHFQLPDSGASQKKVYLKGLAWRRNRWKKSLLLLSIWAFEK